MTHNKVSRQDSGIKIKMAIDYKALYIEECKKREKLEKEHAKLEQEYGQLLQTQDMMFRALRNKKLAPVSKDLYMSLIDTWPDVLSGRRTKISVREMRENAGGASKSAAGNFLAWLDEMGIVEYDSGQYDCESGERAAYITANEALAYPEFFDSSKAQRAKKAKETAAERRARAKAALLAIECENCGKATINYDISAVCTSCGHRHEAVRNVDGQRILIEDVEEEEETDDMPLDSQIEQQALIPAAAPAPEPAKIPPSPAHKCKYCSEELARPYRLYYWQEGGYHCSRCDRPA